MSPADRQDAIRADLGLPPIDRRTQDRRQSDRDLEALRAHLGVSFSGRHDRRTTRAGIRSLVGVVRSLERSA